MAGDNASAAIINAVWAAYLALGIPMHKSVMAISTDLSNAYVVNLFDVSQVVYGQLSQQLDSQKVQSQADLFRETVLGEYHRVLS